MPETPILSAIRAFGEAMGNVDIKMVLPKTAFGKLLNEIYPDPGKGIQIFAARLDIGRITIGKSDKEEI